MSHARHVFEVQEVSEAIARGLSSRGSSLLIESLLTGHTNVGENTHKRSSADIIISFPEGKGFSESKPGGNFCSLRKG